VIDLCGGGIQRGGGIGVMGMGMRFGRGKMAFLVAMRDGARLLVSMPAVGSGAGTIVGGGWWSGNFGGEGGSLGGDLLGGGGRGDGGPDDGEGEAERDGDADLGAEAQRGTAAPAAQERGGGAAGRAAGHRHAAAGGGPVSWWGRGCRCEWLAWTLGGGAVEGWRLGEAKRRSRVAAAAVGTGLGGSGGGAVEQNEPLPLTKVGLDFQTTKKFRNTFIPSRFS